MNKTELIHRSSSQNRTKKSQASLAVDTLLESIQQALQKGETVPLIGFGTFEVRERLCTRRTESSTGESLTISARKVPAFKAGKHLKEAVSN
jgi:DNA-binding protein HU-beta